MNLFTLAILIRQDPFERNAQHGDLVPPAVLANESRDQGPPPDSKVIAERTMTRRYIQSPPRYADLSLSLSLALVGLYCASQVPADRPTLFVMHLCPLLMVLPIGVPGAVVPLRWRRILCLSNIYAVIGLFSLFIRVKAHWNVWSQQHLLIPTFFSHPAQSSISADTVCISLSVMYDYIYHRNWEARRTTVSDSPFLLMVPILGPSTTIALRCAFVLRRAERKNEAFWKSVDGNKELRGQDLFTTTKITSTVYQPRKSAGTES
jgi:hypothetical protein